MLDKKVIRFTRDGVQEENLATGKSSQLTQSEHGRQLKYTSEQFVYHSSSNNMPVSRAGPHIISHANARKAHETVIDTSFTPGRKAPIPRAAILHATSLKGKNFRIKRSLNLNSNVQNPNESIFLAASFNSINESPSQQTITKYAAIKSAVLKSKCMQRGQQIPVPSAIMQPNPSTSLHSAAVTTTTAKQKLHTAATAKALKGKLQLAEKGARMGTNAAADALQKSGDGNAGLDTTASSVHISNSVQQLSGVALSKKLQKRAARIAAMRKAKEGTITAARAEQNIQETAATAKSTLSTTKVSPKKLIIIPVAIILILILLVTTTTSGLLSSIFGQNTSSVPLPAAVQNYRPVVSVYAAQFGMTDYVDLILAVMAQESGGKGLDPMQAAENTAYNKKYPAVQNGIQDPQYSIWCGIQELKEALRLAGCTSPYDMEHIKLALQAYNYGTGFILGAVTPPWPGTHIWTQALADDFHNRGGGGDPQYIEHVLRYYSGIGGGLGYADTSFQNVKKIGESLLGTPYVLGGDSPGVAMDCSSFVCYVYTKAGKNMPRTTAQGIYDQYCTPVTPSDAKAGDLIFFKNTYNCGETITHVGIYCGNGVMLEEGGTHVQYANCSSGYWQSHFYAYGRVK
jgi:hypothetical protein